MDRVKGSMECLSSMQLTADMEGLDAQSKTVLQSREVLAVILQETVEEYSAYSRKEIMGFIEADSITDKREVSTGRTNTQLWGDSPEFVQLNEKTSNFDLMFQARNPILSDENVCVNLHIDLESQKTYRPGYPIEKRGMYYLARSLSSQLSVITGQTDYRQLEKCCSIWICREDIPQREHYSVSFYEMANVKNIGENRAPKENFDLMKLVVIKLGKAVYNGGREDEGYELFRFLNAIMYPHRDDFMEIMSEYIDFSANEELWKEEEQVNGLGLSIFKEGFQQGVEQGIEQGIEQGVVQGAIRACQSFGKSKEDAVSWIQEKFSVSQENAITYVNQYWI